MTKDETKELIHELLAKPSALYMATIDENELPYIRAVFNLRCEEKFPHPAKVIKEYDPNTFTIYISTNTSSLKVKHIQENKKVALYFSIPSEVKGIMLQGEVEILDDMEFKKKIWMDDWTKYYREGYTDPDFTILKLKPKYIKGWFRGHHILEVDDLKD